MNKQQKPFWPPDPADGSWNFKIILSVLFITLIFEMMFLPCLCSIGTAKIYLALICTFLFLGRILVAKIRKEKNSDWKIYCILIVLSPFVIELSLGH